MNLRERILQAFRSEHGKRKDRLSFDELSEGIKSVNPPLSESAEGNWAKLIGVGAKRARLQALQEFAEEFEVTKKCADLAREGLEGASERWEEAITELARTVHGKLLLGLVLLIGAASCFAAEFGLNLVTLPFLLGIRRDTLLAILLAAAPAMALVVLHRVFETARLGALWPTLKVSKGIKRIGLLILTTVFLCGLTAVNVGMVIHLARSRGEVSVLHAILERPDGTAAVSVNRQELTSTIQWVSVVLTIDGALLLLWGDSYSRRWWRRMCASWRVQRTKQSVDEARNALVEAEARLKICQWERIHAEEKARLAGEGFERLLRAELARSLSKPAPNRSSLEIVNELLSPPRIAGRSLPSAQSGQKAS